METRSRRKKRASSTYEIKYHSDFDFDFDPELLSGENNAEIPPEIKPVNSTLQIMNSLKQIYAQPVTIKKHIQEGVSAKVFYGLWGNMEVAIKTFNHEFSSSYQTEKNIYTLLAAGMMQSDYIIKLYGFADDAINPSLVVELIKGGDLLNYIDKLRQKNTFLSDHRILELGLEISKGIQCLHGYKIIHRDIKSENILVTEDEHVKLCDFGSAIEEVNLADEENLVGTIKNVAPEILKNNKLKYSEYSDMYAYGIVLFELSHSRTAYGTLEKFKVLDYVCRNWRPIISRKDCPKVSSLIYSCWNENPKKRPTADRVVARIGYVLSTNRQ